MRRSIIEKQKKVEELKNMINGKKTVMIATIEGMPANLMQKLRKALKGKALIKVYKNVVIKRALEQLGGDYEKLLSYVEGHPSAIVVSDEDPIRLYREIESVHEYAPLRPGKPSPVDVILEPGPVPVPVTMLAEVKAAGLPVRSVKGSVQLEKEFVAVKAGEVVDEKIAKALEIMGIKPVKVYLKVLAALHSGILFTEDVLSIKPQDVLEDIKRASSYAFNLSYNARYPTKLTAPYFLAEAHQKALNLAINAGILTEKSAPYLILKAYTAALSLASKLPPEALDEKAKVMVSSVQSTTENKEVEEEKEEEEEKKEEEEATAGLAALFG